MEIAATESASGVVVVAGEAGVGKSRLASEVTALLRGRGQVTASGRAVEGSQVPLRLVSEIATELFRRVGDGGGDALAGFLPLLAHVAPVRSVAPSATISLPVLASGVLELCTAARCATIVVEDAHWADPASLEILEVWADRSNDAGVTLIVTTRDDESSPGLAWSRRVAARSDWRWVRLTRLSAVDTAELARVCVAAVGNDGVDVELVVRRSGGLPLLVEGLASEAGRGDGVPVVFADVVRRRLRNLSADERRVVALAALIGGRAESEVLVEAERHLGLAETDVSVVEAALRAADLAGLVEPDGEGWRFRHALIAEAVSAHVLPAERRRLAGSLAAALAGEPGPSGPATIIRAAELYAVAGETTQAVAVLADAAKAARTAGQLTPAVDLGESAQRLLEAESAHGRSDAWLAVSVPLLECLVASGAVTRAVEVGEAVLGVVEDPLRRPLFDRATLVGVHLLIARARSVSDTAEARSHVRRARRAAGRDPWLRARIDAVDASVTLGSNDPDRLAMAETLAARAADAAQTTSMSDVACEAFEVLGRCRRMRNLAEGQAAFENQLEAAQRSGDVLSEIRALSELGTIDALRDLDGDRMRLAHRSAVGAGALTLAAQYEINLVVHSLFTGHHARAEQEADECEQLAERLGLHAVADTARLWQATIAAFRGHAAEVDARLSRVRDGRALDIEVAEWGLCRAMNALVQEDRAGARASFAKADELTRAQAPLLGNVSGGPALLLALVAGDVPAGITIDDPDRFEVRWDRMHYGFCAAVDAGLRGQRDRAEAFLSIAREAGAVYSLHGPLYLRLTAEAALRDGWGDPIGWLMEAEAAFIAHGLTALTSACRALLRQAGVTVGRSGATREADVPPTLRGLGVTAREFEILHLVTQRLTNKEIAGRLYLSVRTVEKHLASLLSKSATYSRGELRTRATSNGWIPPMT